MTSVPEIVLAPLSSSVEDPVDDDAFGPTFSSWKPVEVPAPRRPSPTPLLVLAVLAGIGAMALGGVAVVAATRSADEPAPPPAPPPAKVISSPTSKLEQGVLALLAKPSTDRVVFRGSGGRLVLVVGSGGRAAILIRGFEDAPAGWPYYAWVVRGGGKIVRAARFTGADRAVFLSARLERNDSVVVAPDRAAALRPQSARIVALRG